MLIKTIRAEGLKLRHSPVWLAFIMLPILPAIMGTFNYMQNLDILKDEWYSLWTQHTLFSCYFFLPAIIAVYCSYLWRLEHTNHNWNVAMTAPVKVLCLYSAKLAAAAAMVLLTQIWTGVLFIISGKLSGITAPIPTELPVWLACGAAGGMVICALQLAVSLLIRSFAVPVGIAMAGSMVGMAALIKGYGVWFPYSLISLGMRANNPGGPMQCSSQQFFINCILYMVLFSILSVQWIKRHDVNAG